MHAVLSASKRDLYVHAAGDQGPFRLLLKKTPEKVRSSLASKVGPDLFISSERLNLIFHITGKVSFTLNSTQIHDSIRYSDSSEFKSGIAVVFFPHEGNHSRAQSRNLLLMAM